MESNGCLRTLAMQSSCSGGNRGLTGKNFVHIDRLLSEGYPVTY